MNKSVIARLNREKEDPEENRSHIPKHPFPYIGADVSPIENLQELTDVILSEIECGPQSFPENAIDKYDDESGKYLCNVSCWAFNTSRTEHVQSIRRGEYVMGKIAFAFALSKPCSFCAWFFILSV